jgi:hypothetical protein
MIPASGASSDYVPTPANNYGIRFGNCDGISGPDRKYKDWENPYAPNPDSSLSQDHTTSNPNQTKIQPYIPCDNSALKSLFEENIQEIKCISCSEYYFLDGLKDALTTIYIQLEPKDLVIFSEVSRCCYLAMKSNAVWQIQLYKLLPNVKFLVTQVCSFTPEQQFQIIFHKICNRKKPFIAQLQHYEERVLEIKETMKESYSLNIFRELDYDGRPESIDPTSSIGQCLTALRLICPMEFDKQTIFVEHIMASEVAKNIHSSATIDIQEVEDDDGRTDTYGL